jgi:hypothetical protein
MNWPLALCLVAATVFAALFMVIVREIFREVVSPKILTDVHEPDLLGDEDRTAQLMLRHSFILTMMDRYQAIGAQRDVIDFINDELCIRNASWRVRVLPDSRGEFYDLKPTKRLSAIFSRAK